MFENISASGVALGRVGYGHRWRRSRTLVCRAVTQSRELSPSFLRQKVATLFRGLRREKVAPAGQLGVAVAVTVGNDYASKACPTN